MAQDRVNSYERTKEISSDSVEIQNSVEPIDTKAIASGKASKGIEIDTESVLSTAKLDEEVFMRDELEVFVNESTNENDPAFVELNVNGDYRLIMRGDTVNLRRYHVAVLAQAKQSRVRQRKIMNPDGSMGFSEDNVLSLTYPFSVTSDPRGKVGGDWLKQQLANPV
jgi:hypothetical protein